MGHRDTRTVPRPRDAQRYEADGHEAEPQEISERAAVANLQREPLVAFLSRLFIFGWPITALRADRISARARLLTHGVLRPSRA